MADEQELTDHDEEPHEPRQPTLFPFRVTARSLLIAFGLGFLFGCLFATSLHVEFLDTHYTNIFTNSCSGNVAIKHEGGKYLTVAVSSNTLLYYDSFEKPHYPPPSNIGETLYWVFQQQGTDINSVVLLKDPNRAYYIPRRCVQTLWEYYLRLWIR